MTEPREPETPQPPAMPPLPPQPAPPAMPAPDLPVASGVDNLPPVAPPLPPVAPPAPDLAPPAVAEVAPQDVMPPTPAAAGEPVLEGAPEAVEAAPATPVVPQAPIAEPEAVTPDAADAPVVPTVTEGAMEPPVVAPPVAEPESEAVAPVIPDAPVALDLPQAAAAEPEQGEAPLAETTATPAEPVATGPILPAVPAWTAPPVEPEALEPDVAEPAVAETPVVQEQEPAAVMPLLPPPPPAAVEPIPEAVPAPENATSTWGEAAEPQIPGADDIFRGYGEPTAGEAAALSEEERKLAAERAARRDARTAALTAPSVVAAGETMVDSSPTAAVKSPAPVVAKSVTQKTDRFWGSLGLLLVRLALAVIFGVHGIQMLLDPARTKTMFATTALPSPDMLGTITAVASLLIAVSMVMGLATRYSAAGAVIIAAGSLAFYFWGAFSVFEEGKFGFLGESALLIAAVGLLLVFIGGGGWSLDRSLRSARENDRSARAANAE